MANLDSRLPAPASYTGNFMLDVHPPVRERRLILKLVDLVPTMAPHVPADVDAFAANWDSFSDADLVASEPAACVRGSSAEMSLEDFYRVAAEVRARLPHIVAETPPLLMLCDAVVPTAATIQTDESGYLEWDDLDRHLRQKALAERKAMKAAQRASSAAASAATAVTRIFDIGSQCDRHGSACSAVL